LEFFPVQLAAITNSSAMMDHVFVRTCAVTDNTIALMVPMKEIAQADKTPDAALVNSNAQLESASAKADVAIVKLTAAMEATKMIVVSSKKIYNFFIQNFIQNYFAKYFAKFIIG
jgi:hypothetical protein